MCPSKPMQTRRTALKTALLGALALPITGFSLKASPEPWIDYYAVVWSIRGSRYATKAAIFNNQPAAQRLVARIFKQGHSVRSCQICFAKAPASAEVHFLSDDAGLDL